MEPRDLVEAYTLNDSTKAAMIKQFLQAEGIHCFLGGEQAADLGLSAFEVKIMVPASDAKRARELIDSHEVHTKE